MTCQKFGIAGTFGVPAPAGAAVEGFSDSTHPRIPPRIDDYVFHKDALRNVLAFLNAPHGGGLLLTGPTGAGKSSLITQIAARLNWPVHEMTWHGRRELSDLIGHHAIVKGGEMKYIHGPLAVALRDGHILLMNEMDLADPSELAGLNGVLDGMPLVIPENEDEVVQAHPKFRLIATGNSVGQGDPSGLYQGVLRQNVAFLDRFRVVTVDYPSADTEKLILSKAAPYLAEPLIDAMIKLANEIRRQFRGDNGNPSLTVPLSTRGLLTWAHLAGAFKSAPNPLAYAFRQIILDKVGPSEREGITGIARSIFGESWDKQ